MPPRKKREPRADGVVALVPEVIEDDERPYLAYQLRNQGNDWPAVARLLGYASADQARLTVQTYMQRTAMSQSRERREEVLMMQMDRLDDLYRLAYAQASEGDLKGVDSCVRIVGQVSKLWGLEDKSEKVTNQTVVVTEGEFAEVLKAHVQGRSA